MKKLIGFVVLLALAGGGWWYYIKYGKPPEKATVNYASVSQGTILESVTSTGTLEPERRFDVGSQVSGTVMAIYADYNDIVKKNQLLAEIDPSLLQTQVEIRKAAIARQESDIENQKVQLEDQKKQLERTRNLAEKGLQNTQQLEAAELAVKTRVAQIGSAQKSLVQAQADLAQAEMNVSYTKIKAPDDGVVVERRVDVGQTVQASMTTPQFFILAKPLENLRLTALVDEADIGRIRPGMEVRFTVEAYGQQNFTGYVDAVRLNASVANNVVTYPVWISVPNNDLRLRPSMTASLKIILSTAENVIRVPNSATRFRPNAEIYKALGLEPPAPGSGGRLGGPNNEDARNNPAGGANRGNRQGTDGQGAQAGQGAQSANRQPGQNAQGTQGGNRQPGTQNAQNAQGGGAGNRQPGAQGTNRQGGGQNAQAGAGRTPGGGGMRGGNNPDFASMTPEQRQAMMERFARNGGGGRGGGGRGGNQAQGGRGQGAGGRGQQTTTPATAAPGANPNKIDAYWAPVVRTNTPGAVWTWNETAKELKQHPIRLGVSDGTFSELVSGDLKVGDQLITGVILPASMRATTTGNPLLGGQPNRNMGGMTPGGPGGGGNPGGGGAGGGRGGGGGGGGRGGGN
jgi:HlyD family secretion protein